jgi:hypothetical protein
MRWNQLLQCLTLPSLLAVITLSFGSVASAASTYKVLYSFKGGSDGGGVFAGIAFDTKGNLYGTTTGGGAYGEGTAFELKASSGGKWSETILHSFCAQSRCTDGASPQSTPVFDASGNLYGTTNGTSFELSPSQRGWTFKVIYEAGSASGYSISESGNLYGANGGVWELFRGTEGWSERFFHIFCRTNCRDGENALAPPVFDAAGNLYGTTEFGGNMDTQWCPTSGGCGVAYQVQSLGGGKWQYRVLHRFGAFSNDGQLPYNASVTLDSKGNVYGTTLYGGIGGTVFELSPRQDGSWKETILYNFANFQTNGGAPVGGVTFDNLGNLYGTASAG